MMQSFLFALAFTICKSKTPPTWGKYGEYPCTNKSVEVGGYVSGYSQHAILMYPTAAIEQKQTLPFIAFAHGMTAGGAETLPAYINVMQFVCSHGYIIGAPQSCAEVYCQRFYQDVITTITTMSSKKGKIDPALEYADFTKIAVYGHSMGGAATVHVSDRSDLNITCSAPMHPSVVDDSDKNESKDVAVPTLWFTGSDDTTVPPNGVYNGYNADPTTPKIFAEIKGASHTSGIEMEATYIAQYFDCIIRNDENACSYFFDKNGANNICSGGMVMTKCYVDNGNKTIIIKQQPSAKKLEGSWSYCSGEDAKECPLGKYGNMSSEIIPKQPPVGSNFSIIGIGYCLERINNPSISMRMVDGTLMDTTIKDEGCGAHKYIFPLSDGVLYYQGIQCPVMQGPVNITFVTSISSLGWHSADGTAVVTFKLYDQPNQEGNCVMCTDTTFKMTG